MADDNFEEYLDKDFDYTKLTKQALRKIMYDNGIEDIPPLRFKKDEILVAYKKHIYDRIDEIKGSKIKEKRRVRNEYQKDRSSILDLNIKSASKNKNIEDTKINKNSEQVSSNKRPKTPVKEDKQEVYERPIMLRRHSVENIESSDESDSDDEKIKLIKPTDKQTKNTKVKIKKVNGTKKTEDETLIRNEVMSDITFTEDESIIENKNKSKNKRYSLKKVNRKEVIDENTVPRSGIYSFIPVRFIYIVLFSLIIIAYIYLKFFCPYCKKDNELFCVPLPKHSRLVNGKIKCDKGYLLFRNPIKNFCIVDDTKERQIQRTVKNIVRKLELKNGDFLYGMTTTSMIPLAELTEDKDVIEMLKNVPGINIHEDLVYSVNHKTSLKTFVSFYFKKTLFFLLPFVVIALSYKYYLKRRKRLEEIRNEAKTILKDINNVLMRQVITSTKNKGIPSFVVLEQLKDVYGDNECVWKEVVKMIENNSNININNSDNRRILEWIGPIINMSEINSPLL